MEKEYKKHHIIRLKFLDNFKLYLANMLPDVVCQSKCFNKKAKFQKLFNVGKDKVDAHLDIIKMIYNNSMIKTLMKNSLMNKEVKYQLAHQQKQLIDIDNSSSESSDEASVSNCLNAEDREVVLDDSDE